MGSIGEGKGKLSRERFPFPSPNPTLSPSKTFTWVDDGTGGAEAETLCAALTDEACPPRAQPAAAFIRKNSPTRAASANAPSSARKA